MIILTGASGGIGKAILPYLAEIDNVIAIYNSNKPSLSNSSCIQYNQLDLLDSDALGLFINECETQLKKITVIHGAAVKIDQLTIQYEEESWNRVIDCNLKSNYLLTKALLPLMIKQNWGRIISITSTGAMRGSQGTLAYSASKSGLCGLTRVYATEYARFNITANLLSLGYFECGLYDSLSKDIQNKLRHEIPSKRLGNVHNISQAIFFLMQSDFTNGATINIDGGI